MKRKIPWHVRIILKSIVARLPFQYSFWVKLNLFRHGDMQNFEYALKTTNFHIQTRPKPNNWRGIEIGPGDSLMSGFIAHSQGAERFILLDAGSFANMDIKRYIPDIKKLSGIKSNILNKLDECLDAKEALHEVNSEYLTNGLYALEQLPTSYFDIIYSQAVFEHIHKNEVYKYIQECYRVLKPGAVTSHVIDFKDHLNGKSNNMRFSDKTWESDWFAKKGGFYTNRIPFSQMADIFNKVGFELETKILATRSVSMDELTTFHSDKKGVSLEDLKITSALFIGRVPTEKSYNQ